MSPLRGGGVVVAALLLVGCAHHITITPPLSALTAADTTRIDKAVAYYIAPADRAREVTTPGGGGDKVTYLPYAQSEPALKRVLSNVFTKVMAIPSLDDKRYLAHNAIAYLLGQRFHVAADPIHGDARLPGGRRLRRSRVAAAGDRRRQGGVQRVQARPRPGRVAGDPGRLPEAAGRDQHGERAALSAAPPAPAANALGRGPSA